MAANPTQADSAGAWLRQAQALLKAGRHREALHAAEQARSRQPGSAAVEQAHFEAAWKALHDAVNHCDWRDYDQAQDSVIEHIRRGRAFVGETTLTSARMSGEILLASARNFYQPYAATPQIFSHKPPGERIRLGLVGADFRQQATAYLLTGVIEQFDRSRFELIGYDFGPADNGQLRKRSERAYDRLVPIHDLSDREAAQRIHADGIDLLLHLRGLANGRIGLFAHRPAAIQMHYLYYPGTSGAPCMDYIVADDFVIPPEHEPHYAERVLRLPGCYQPNDTRRALPAPRDRASFGLPPQAVVMANFSQNYKITPPMFQLWCRLLAAAPERLLWLLVNEPEIQARLRSEASAQGIAPERIVFTPSMPTPDHLARLRACDVVLDTFPYGGHTLTSDALWAGAPVVTLAGRTFASRVAGSLLRAAGLEQLLAWSPTEYFSIADQLLRDPARRRRIQDDLTAQRGGLALFDSAAYARKFEAALLTVVAARWPRATP
jgi:protein O-GlcNAc transferase